MNQARRKPTKHFAAALAKGALCSLSKKASAVDGTGAQCAGIQPKPPAPETNETFRPAFGKTVETGMT
jgi:hypothetical protein